jgi:hypothetical protein
MSQLLELAAVLGPEIIKGIREGAEIYERLQNGDETAVEQAKDWLGVTDKVSDAIASWEASKT